MVYRAVSKSSDPMRLIIVMSLVDYSIYTI